MICNNCKCVTGCILLNDQSTVTYSPLKLGQYIQRTTVPIIAPMSLQNEKLEIKSFKKWLMKTFAVMLKANT